MAVGVFVVRFHGPGVWTLLYDDVTGFYRFLGNDVQTFLRRFPNLTGRRLIWVQRIRIWHHCNVITSCLHFRCFAFRFLVWLSFTGRQTCLHPIREFLRYLWEELRLIEHRQRLPERLPRLSVASQLPQAVPLPLVQLVTQLSRVTSSQGPFNVLQWKGTPQP